MVKRIYHERLLHKQTSSTMAQYTDWSPASIFGEDNAHKRRPCISKIRKYKDWTPDGVFNAMQPFMKPKKPNGIQPSPRSLRRLPLDDPLGRRRPAMFISKKVLEASVRTPESSIHRPCIVLLLRICPRLMRMWTQLS